MEDDAAGYRIGGRQLLARPAGGMAAVTKAHHANFGGARRVKVREARVDLRLLHLPREGLDPIQVERRIRLKSVAIGARTALRDQEFAHNDAITLLGEAVRDGTNPSAVPTPHVGRHEDGRGRRLARDWRLVDFANAAITLADRRRLALARIFGLEVRKRADRAAGGHR